MAKDNKAPKLRFPGFTEDWEQRKLGDIFEYEQPGPYIVRSTRYSDSFETPVLTAGQSFVLGYTDETEGIKKASKSNPVIVFDDFTTSSHYVDFPFKVKSSAMKLLTLKDVNDDNYCANKVLQNIGYIPQNHERHWISKFSFFDVLMPKHEEQKIIGGFYREIDTLITLHQSKLETMKEYKKGMLQKMFPRAGETVPEVRFPGFTGEWEQRSVGDLFSIIKTKNAKESVDNVITNSAEYGLIPQRDYFDKDIAVEGRTNNYTVIEKGDFVYNPRKSSSAPYGPFNCYTLENKGIVSPLYICLKPRVNDCTDYLLWYFKASLWHAYIENNGAQGGARHDRVGMTNDLMKGIPVWLPPLEEQQAIAEFLNKIELLVTSQQRKLDQMKEYKKGLLQQMFV